MGEVVESRDDLQTQRVPRIEDIDAYVGGGGGGVEAWDSNEDDSTDAWADSEYDSQDESEDSHFTFVRTISKTYREGEKMVTYLRRCRRLYPEEVEEKKVEEWDPTDLN